MQVIKTVLIILILCSALVSPCASSQSAADSNELEIHAAKAKPIPLDKWYWRNTSAQNFSLYKIVYAFGSFIANQNGGFIYSSDNGIGWSRKSKARINNEGFSLANNRLFMRDSVHTGKIKISKDGGTWVEYETNIKDSILEVTYGKGIYAGIGGHDIYCSSNGITWSKKYSNPDIVFSDIAYGNGTFVAVDFDSNLLISANGKSWKKVSEPCDDPFNCVFYLNSVFIALGWNGNILTSTNGVNWVAQNSGTKNDLYSATYGGGNYVVVGEKGTILTSEDFTKWTNSSMNTTCTFWDIACGKSTFVVTGSDGAIVQAGIIAPWGLKAADITTHSAKLQWKYNNDAVTGFRIYRVKSGDSKYTCIATVKSGIYSFTDSSLDPKAGYSYYVEAYRGNYTGSSSDTLKVTPPLEIKSAGG